MAERGALTPRERELVDVVQREVERLRELAYVPGDWACPKCGYVESRRVVSARTGHIAAATDAALPCPNDGMYMERATWRDRVEALRGMWTETEAALAGAENLARLHEAERVAAAEQLQTLAAENAQLARRNRELEARLRERNRRGLPPFQETDDAQPVRLSSGGGGL